MLNKCIDINLTSVCNYGCKYCSEGQNPEVPTQMRILNSKTKVLESEFINFVDAFSEGYQIMIGFWGGEPFINYEYAKHIIEHYINDPLKRFMFYSNGYYIERYIDSLDELNQQIGDPNRLYVQISYDGKDANDLLRVTKTGKSTSEICVKALNLLKSRGINTNFKATIAPQTFKYLYSSFKELIENYGVGYYFPTPDAFADYTDPHFDDLQASLLKIAKYIYNHNLPANTFKWFTDSKALCQAGVDYYAIDLDGEITPCHSTMYEMFSKHRIGNIRDIDIIDKLANAKVKYENLLYHMNDFCGDCKVRYCMRCPAGCFNLQSSKDAYNNSDKSIDQYQYLWTHPNANMCRVFKISNVIYNSLLKAIQLRDSQKLN